MPTSISQAPPFACLLHKKQKLTAFSCGYCKRIEPTKYGRRGALRKSQQMPDHHSPHMSLGFALSLSLSPSSLGQTLARALFKKCYGPAAENSPAGHLTWPTPLYKSLDKLESRGAGSGLRFRKLSVQRETN